MTVDERVKCNGLDMRDKKDWDGKYPYIEPTKAGFVVHMSKRAKLPGVFTDRERAERAHAKYLGKIVEADERIKAKKKGN